MSLLKFIVAKSEFQLLGCLPSFMPTGLGYCFCVTILDLSAFTDVLNGFM
jgi:hypothetical protein